jgi:hypothetical protein
MLKATDAKCDWLVFEPCEHVLDFVALTKESAIIVDWNFSIGFGWDARRYASFAEGISKAIGVIAGVAEELFGFGQGGQQQRRPSIVSLLIMH